MASRAALLAPPVPATRHTPWQPRPHLRVRRLRPLRSRSSSAAPGLDCPVSTPCSTTPTSPGSSAASSSSANSRQPSAPRWPGCGSPGWSRTLRGRAASRSSTTRPTSSSLPDSAPAGRRQAVRIDPGRDAALDTTTRMALGAGFSTLRRGHPAVMHYKKTTIGSQLPDRWGLPHSMRTKPESSLPRRSPATQPHRRGQPLQRGPRPPRAPARPRRRPDPPQWQRAGLRRDRRPHRAAQA